MKIYNGYKRLNENYTLLTDEYEYTMANTYLESKKHNQKSVFDVFFRNRKAKCFCIYYLVLFKWGDEKYANMRHIFVDS
jgi:hypothetical protein